MDSFTVTAPHTDSRLDKFLTEMTGQTRSQIQRQIKFGLVLVNGKKARVHEFLKLNDKVEMSAESKVKSQKSKVEGAESKVQSQKSKVEVAESRVQSQKSKVHGKTSVVKRIKGLLQRKDKQSKELVPKIIFKCDEYVVIEKPAGLLVHETKISTEPTLVDWLVKKFPEIDKVADTESLRRGDHTFRPGIVHRLDREVAGVMIVARTQSAFDHLKQQFKDHKVTKEYVALVYGDISQDEGIINFEISRKTDKGIMAAHPFKSGKGRPALTKFEVLQRFTNATLVKIKLETGRTNQIRVHFNALNHPLVGDKVYKQNKFSNSSIKSDNILLFARELKFIDPSGEEKTFSAEMPEYFTAVLNKLQKL